MFTIQWTDMAKLQRDRFLSFGQGWESFMIQTSDELANYAQEYFKPMLNVRSSPRGNGDTKDSIKHDITHGADGFTITYSGLLSAYYMDVGNFPPGAVLAANAFGMKNFPVDARYGAKRPSAQIHGMGSFTSGVPTHWSEETVKHMANDGKALEIAIEHMAEFLNEVVIMV